MSEPGSSSDRAAPPTAGLQPASSPAPRPRRGLLLDAAVLAMNLLAVGPLARLAHEGEDFRPAFGALALAAFAAQGLGAWLKRRPLQARRLAAGAPVAGTAARIGLFVLLVMHWGLFLTLLVVGLEAVLPAASPPASGSFTGIAAIGLGWLPTALTVAALVRPRDPARPGWRSGPAAEAAGDLLLAFSVVVALALWEGVFTDTLAGAAPRHPLLALLLIVLATVPFAIFYLAPRLLFLVEDYRTAGAWIGSALAMLPLAIRLLG